MSARRGLPALVVLLCAVAGPVAGETVVETWRSPFGTPRSISVNSSDGSVWAVTGATVTHLAADGTILSETVEELAGPVSVSVNSSDGSCWVAYTGKWEGSAHQGSAVVHLSAAGAELWRGVGFNAPGSVSVNPSDGSCWVADTINYQVVHLSAAGAELWRGGDFFAPASVSVNPSDGSCWVADTANDQVVHLSASGTEVWRSAGYPTFRHPNMVSVNARNGSCWVVDSDHEQVVHLSAGGMELWRGGEVWGEITVSVNSTDGSCWVASSGVFSGSGHHDSAVVHLSASGTELWRGSSDFTSNWPSPISVDPSDGSCWVGTPWDDQILHLSAGGAELWRGGPPFLGAMSVNSSDGSWWVADGASGQVVHLSADGTVLWRGGEFVWPGPTRVSVDSADGSCRVTTFVPGNAGMEQLAVVYLSEAGDELWRVAGSYGGGAVSVDASDGSCWVTDGYDQIVHLSASGAELWRGGGFVASWSLSVNSSDGSCWVACAGEYAGDSFEGAAVVHLSAAGEELWRGEGFVEPVSVSVNSSDGSCWVGDFYGNQVVHLSATGAELWRGGGFWPSCVSADASDGSCWVADASGVIHLSASGAEEWRGERFPSPGCVAVNASDGSCWVGDGVDDQIAHLSVIGPRFTASPWAGTAPLEVGFEYLTGSEVASAWRWDFGDGGSSTEENPRHQYLEVGTYPVALTMDGASGPETETKEHYIHVTFPDVPFQPVPHWALHQILACVDAGIVEGFGDGSYRPDLPVTRDAMAVYIARALVGGDAAVPTGPGTATFADVPNTGYGEGGTDPYWAYKYIEYCVSRGVVQGYDATHYRPELIVARDQMAVFVARATGWVHIGDYMISGRQLFSDIPWDFWCGTAIEACVDHYVVQGYGDGTYGPGRPVTRDQMAVYIQRAFELPL